jgi:hypothetical protein
MSRTHLIGTIGTTHVTSACGVWEPDNMTGDTEAVDCKRCRGSIRFDLLTSPFLQRDNPVIAAMLAYRRAPPVVVPISAADFTPEEHASIGASIDRIRAEGGNA